MNALTAVVVVLLFGAAGLVQGAPASAASTAAPQTATSDIAMQECLAQEAADQAAHDQVRQSVLQLSNQRTHDDRTIEQEMQPYYAQAARDDQSIRADRARVQSDEAVVAHDQHDLDALRAHSDTGPLEQQLTAQRSQAGQDAQTLAQDQAQVRTDDTKVQQDGQAIKQLETQRASTYRTSEVEAHTVPIQASQRTGQSSTVTPLHAQQTDDDRAYDQQVQALRAEYAHDSQTLEQDRARAGADSARLTHDQQAVDALVRQLDYTRRFEDRTHQLQARLDADTNTLTRDRATFRADYAAMEQAMQTLAQFRQQRAADDQAIEQQLRGLRAQYVTTWQVLQRIEASCAKLKSTSAK